MSSVWMKALAALLVIAGCAQNASEKPELEELSFAEEDSRADTISRHMTINGTIGVGQSIEGVYRGADYVGYLITLKRGAQVSFKLESDDADSVLYLYGPQTARSRWSSLTAIKKNDDENRDTFNSRIDFRTTKAGTYLVVAFDYWKASGGHFTLSATNTGSGEAREECGADNSCPAGAECNRIFCIRAPCPSFCAPVDPTIQCTTDADCTQINEGCCPCQSGGQVRAVNASFASALSPICEESTICPAVYMCNGDTPQCAHNRCEMLAPPVTPEPEGRLCGTRGVPFDCGEGQFCNRPITANCGRADAPGRCEAIPTVCNKALFPVCGCDGETYANTCYANAAGISVDYTGACESR